MEKDMNFGLRVEIENGGGYETSSVGCHVLKVIGGKEFHEPDVNSVCVYDRSGNVYLYLRKGHPEKTINVHVAESF